jgi:malonyl-CoA O-methyltransferase
MKTLMQRIGITRDLRTPVERAIEWVKDHRIPNSGVVVHHKTRNVTPEVTGYLIASLYNAGEKDLAYDLAEWEASVQKPDGSFAAPGSEVSYTFDTAQVVRGFLAVIDDMPELESNLRRACDYVERYISETGEVKTVSYDMWKLPDGSMLSDYGNLYVLPPMLEAGIKLGEQKYINAARRGMEYFRKFPDLVEFKPKLGMLSHYFGYMMEALVDLGEEDLAYKGLRQAQFIQKADGSIPAYPGATWVCATGMAQLALAWYKLGNPVPADKAMTFLENIQNSSGGFYGGYGWNVQYFHNQEISWAVKFFLDASYWRDKS